MGFLMVVIRLARAGSTHRPFYHVVVTDSRKRRDSSHIEKIGFFDHFAGKEEKRCKVDMARLEHWVGQGAVLRPSVTKLVKQLKRANQGDMITIKRPAKEAKKPSKKAAAKAAAAAEPAAAPAEPAPAAAEPAKAESAPTEPAAPAAEPAAAEPAPAADDSAPAPDQG